MGAAQHIPLQPTVTTAASSPRRATSAPSASRVASAPTARPQEPTLTMKAKPERAAAPARREISAKELGFSARASDAAGERDDARGAGPERSRLRSSRAPRPWQAPPTPTTGATEQLKAQSKGSSVPSEPAMARNDANSSTPPRTRQDTPVHTRISRARGSVSLNSG